MLKPSLPMEVLQSAEQLLLLALQCCSSAVL
jgi:hypothetical protein